MTQYVATKRIEYGNATAHMPGDPVPAENVERNGWQDSVARVGTKAADAVMGVVPGEGEVVVTAPLSTTVDAAPAPASETPKKSSRRS